MKKKLLLSMLLFVSTLISLNAVDKTEAIETDESLVLRNGKVSLELNKKDFSLKQFSDLVGKVDYVKEPGSGLLSIKLGWGTGVWYVTPTLYTLGGKNFSKRTFKKTKEGDSAGWELSYLSASVGDIGAINAIATVTLKPGSNLFDWQISINNHSPVPLMEIQFPLLSGLASNQPESEKTDYLALPVYSGAKYMSPRTKAIASQGLTEVPSSGLSIQLMTYCDGQGNSLYFATHDAKFYRKTFLCNPTASKEAFALGHIHYAEKKSINDVWTLPYSVLCGPIRGDWYDAAKIYREWTNTQSIFKPLTERADIPDWFKNLNVWFEGQEWAPEKEKLLTLVDELIDLRKKLDEPIGFHWYIWQQYNKHDYRYPDYLPARPGFKEAVKKAQDAGIYAMPYINISNFDRMLPSWTAEKADQFAVRDITGNLYPFGFFINETDRHTDMYPMCLSTSYWKKKLLGIVKQVIDENNVAAIYWDQTNVYPGLCYAANHDHEWIGGTCYYDSVVEIHRETLKMKKDLVTTGEGLCEHMISFCAGQLNAHADLDPNSLPIFQTVHAGRTTEMGVLMSPRETEINIFNAKLAFNLVRGRQLGWFNRGNFVLSSPGLEPQLALLKKYCGARKLGWGFIRDGELLRTPDLSAVTKTKIKWELWPSPEKNDFELPVVFAECYRSQRGEIGIVLANRTETAQTISIPWNEKDWGLKIGAKITREDLLENAWTAATAAALSKELKITIPARAPAIIKIKGVK